MRLDDGERDGGSNVALLAEAVVALAGRMAAMEARPPAQGERGPQGERGSDGVGITAVAITAAGDLEIALSDGRAITLGRVVGRDGIAGADGRDGRDAPADDVAALRADVAALRDRIAALEARGIMTGEEQELAARIARALGD